MTCSAEGRTGGAINTTNKIIHSREPRRLRSSFYGFLAAAGIAASLLIPVFASADTENYFLHSLGSSEQLQDDDIARQQARIAELEKQDTRDTYAPALGEAYLELADSLSAEGNHDGALDAYSNALQVVRVTEGLNSLNQVPILQAQLKTLEQTRQWHRYDETLSLIYTISQDQLPVGDDRRVKALNQLSKWNLRATEDDLLEHLSQDSGELVELYEEELRQVEQSGTTDISDFALSTLKIGEAYARLSQARNTIKKPIREYRSVMSRPTMDRTPCRDTRRGARGGAQSCMAAARPNLDYYRVPQRKKDMEVRTQLEALRLSILDAAKTLEEKHDFPGRNLLVEDFRFLAESFTEIVSQ